MENQISFESLKFEMIRNEIDSELIQLLHGRFNC